jgi:hypothetical protein
MMVLPLPAFDLAEPEVGLQASACPAPPRAYRRRKAAIGPVCPLRLPCRSVAKAGPIQLPCVRQFEITSKLCEITSKLSPIGRKNLRVVKANKGWLRLIKPPLYLRFHLSLSGVCPMGRWNCLPACRREGSRADEFAAPRRWLLAKRAGSQNRSLLCPQLEPLLERPYKASSYLQE